MKIVLTVDRSRVVRAVVERHLERFGCLSIEATTADEAIAAAREHHPALMLVDAGVHAVAARGEDAAYLEVPVVLLTTDHPASTRLRDDPCVVACLRKPFDQSSFDRAVRSVLGSPQVSPAARVHAAQGASR
jgi:CheY-like chemotaxis protein